MNHSRETKPTPVTAEAADFGPFADRRAELVKRYENRGINISRLAAALKYAGPEILDAGCGNGSYVFELADRYNITGVDLHPFDTWSQTPERFRVGDIAKLPYATESVDTILCFEVLEHLSDPLTVLRNFYRIARKNIILTVPNCDISPGMRRSLLTFYHYTDPTHVNFFDQNSISDLVCEAGFKIVENSLINEISLLPLVTEAACLHGAFGRLVKSWLYRRQRRYGQRYWLTCLVVGEK